MPRPESRPADPLPPAPKTELAGALYLVATPIGNLEDVTLRALRILRDVDLVAAEDTRRTAKLLNHYDIHTTTTSLHARNESAKAPRLLERLARGDAIALVSDAGTPLLSDPGARLVRAALAAGTPVHAVPGPSATLAALIVSGFAGAGFTFVGFPPPRTHGRRRWLERIAAEPRPVVLFEAPHRLDATIADLRQTVGDRQVAICRELTKMHEQVVCGPLDEVAARLGEPRGEYTIVLAPAPDPGPARDTAGDGETVWREFCYLTKLAGVQRRAAIRQLAKSHNMAPRAVYSLVEAHKDSSELG